MEEQTMLRILDKVMWYANRNRLYEAKKYIKQELENVQGITEVKCKRRKINKLYCNTCKNCNCKLNANAEYKEKKMDKTQIIDILQEVKENLLENDIGKCLEKINEYLKFIEDKTLLEILNRIKLFLDREELYEAKLYVMLELGNFKDTTPYTCKNTIYDNYDYYCKICTNFNCSSNKNKKDENS